MENYLFSYHDFKGIFKIKVVFPSFPSEMNIIDCD